jgi:hypothetical protein
MLAAAQSDPPGRVGRLNYITGPVSFQPAGVDDWVNADPNRPLTTGDRVWVDDRARAEMHIGSTALRMYSLTAFEFLNLDDSHVQIRLTQGTLSIRLRHLDDNETFEVDTPTVALSLLRPGDYRLDIRPDSNVSVIYVRAGEGEVTGGPQAYTLHPGDKVLIHADQSYDMAQLGPPDAWDSWCIDRDAREDRSVSSRYVSQDMDGWQDLDDNGDWRNTPDYGNVWVPRGVPDGWAPYHNGHWAWVEPWGWTWVDDAPWGFAPFHYGRWAYVGNSWAWVPGPPAVRPVYAPALVAWVGGSSFGVGVSFGGGGGGVGWIPLGPREVFVPSYNVSPTYVNRVNVTNTTITNVNVTNINVTNVTYVNRNAPGALTAVPVAAMGTARPVQQVAVAVQAKQLQSVQIVKTAPVAPQRSAVLGRPEGAAAAKVQPPAAVLNRPVVARTAPPPPPVPFAQRQQELAKNPGKPLDAQAVQQIRAQQPAPARPQIKQVTPTSSAPARPASAPAAAPAPGRPGAPPAREPQPAPQARPQTPPARVDQPAPQARPAAPPPRAEQPAAQPARPPAEPARPAAQPPRPANEPARPPAAEPGRPGNPPRQAQPEKRPPDKNDKKEKKEDEKRKE